MRERLFGGEVRVHLNEILLQGYKRKNDLVKKNFFRIRAREYFYSS